MDSVDWITPAPENARTEKESPDECHQDKVSAELTTCILGDKNGKIHVTVAGDSKTRQWVPALDVAAKKLGWRLEVSTKTACAFTTAPTANGGAKAPYPSCDEWNKKLIARIQREKPDIFINALYKMRSLIYDGEERAVGRPRMVEGVREAIGQVADTGADIILINASPMLDRRIPDCVAAHPDELTRCATPRDWALDEDRVWGKASVERVMSAAPGSQLVDMNDYICPASECAPVIGNILVYRDKHHVTVPYMRTLEPMLRKRLKAVAATF